MEEPEQVFDPMAWVATEPTGQQVLSIGDEKAQKLVDYFQLKVLRGNSPVITVFQYFKDAGLVEAAETKVRLKAEAMQRLDREREIEEQKLQLVKSREERKMLMEAQEREKERQDKLALEEKARQDKLALEEKERQDKLALEERAR